MTSKEIIAELKKRGIDPQNSKPEHFASDEVQDMLAELGVAAEGGDSEAANYYESLMVKIRTF